MDARVSSVRPRTLAARVAGRVLIGAIRAYQLILSPWLGANCRFVPTCSEYAATAITTHGPWRGSWLALRRIARCRPGGGSGYDPVPEAPEQRNVAREL